MRSEMIEVTPDMASDWLGQNNILNRNLRQRIAVKYAADMRAGKWQLTHQGIAFYDDGTLADGQHRLHAIQLAMIPVRMMVTFDVPKATSIGIDQNLARTVSDSLLIGGCDEWIANKYTVAITRSLAERFGETRTDLSASQIEAFARNNEATIKFVLSLTSKARKHGLGSAPIYACLACAFEGGESPAMLTRFHHILQNGEISGPHENSVIRLREFCLSYPGQWHGPLRVSSARKTQRAIKAFCDKTPLTKLYEPESFVYPFPKWPDSATT